MAEEESADKQTAMQLDQPTLEAVIEGVSQRILQASTSRAAEDESITRESEPRTRVSRTDSSTPIVPFSTILRCDPKKEREWHAV